MTLRLFYDYFTTIPAGTLRLLLALISYRAKARKELRRKPPMVPRRSPAPAPCRWTAPPGGGCQTASCRAWEASRPRRADPVQVKTLTAQQARRVCTADSVSALASDPHTVGVDPPPLAWSALLYIPYYNRRSVLTCAASRRGGGIWYWLSVSGCLQALQRGAGGIIAAFVGLVSWAVERVQSQEKPLQSPVRCFAVWVV